MFEIKNCRRCGRTFPSNGITEICPHCYEKDEEDFLRIREYVYDHPGAKIFEVSNVLDISVKTIKRFLKEGRLGIIEENNLFLECERCGCSIRSGQLCEECSIDVAREFKNICANAIVLDAKTKINYVSTRFNYLNRAVNK